MAPVNENITHTISAEWKLNGPLPTVADILKMASDLRTSTVPRDTPIKFEPSYSDITTFPARFYIDPFEIQPKNEPQSR